MLSMEPETVRVRDLEEDWVLDSDRLDVLVGDRDLEGLRDGVGLVVILLEGVSEGVFDDVSEGVSDRVVVGLDVILLEGILEGVSVNVIVNVPDEDVVGVSDGVFVVVLLNDMEMERVGN